MKNVESDVIDKIPEQIKKLRELAKIQMRTDLKDMLNEAADTIEYFLNLSKGGVTP